TRRSRPRGPRWYRGWSQSRFSLVLPCGRAEWRDTRLLRHLIDGERNGLLSGVRVLGARVDLELLDLLISELVLGEHAADGLLHCALGILLEQLGVGDAAEAAGVAGV